MADEREKYHEIKIPKMWWVLDRKNKKYRQFFIAFLIASIIIFISSLFYTALSTQFQNSCKASPHFKSTCYYSEDGDYIVEIGKFSRYHEVGAGQTEYFLIDKNETVLALGKVSDIFGYDLSLSDSNITFFDRDMSGSLTKGDFLVLRSVNNSGIADLGYTFKLNFSENDVTMCKLVLDPEITLASRLPSLRWTVSEIDENNVSFNENSTAANQFQAMGGRPIKFHIEFRYPGNDYLNLTIFWHVDSYIPAKTERDGIYNETNQLFEPYNIQIYETYNITNGEEVDHHQQYNTSQLERDVRRDKLYYMIEIRDNEANQTLLFIHTDFNIINPSETVSSFSTGPILILLAPAAAYSITIAKMKRKNL